MGSHSVTCHPAEVTFQPLPQPKHSKQKLDTFKQIKQIHQWTNSLSKICAPRKSGPEFSKIAKDRLRTNAPQSSRSAKWCTRKALQFLHCSLSWRPRTPSWAKVHQSRAKFCFFNMATCLRDICCPTSLISLKAWPTDQQKQWTIWLSPHTKTTVGSAMKLQNKNAWA